MKPREIRPGIHTVGAIHWDARLFDALIPLPDGTSYNSYLIRGSEKTVLIDTVDPAMAGTLTHSLDQMGVSNIDYVVANHAEQDHSGSIPLVLGKYPGAKIVTNTRCKGMLIDLLMIPEDKVITVEDRETLSLGDRALEFVFTPWVHWPETISTYLKEEKILFSCDFFGAHLATTELYVADEWMVFQAAKRYFAEIMMPFRTSIQRNLEKLKDYDIDIIAPSHGPLYDRPGFIIEAYRDWVFGEPKNIVVLPYVTMHGSTYQMVEYLTEAMVQKGIIVKPFDMRVTDSGKLAMALVDAATLVLGAPTMLAGSHPSIAYAAFLVNALRPKLKFFSIIGSYGWVPGTREQLTGMLSGLKAEFLEPVFSKGVPKETEYAALDDLSETIAQKHRENSCI